MKCEKCRYYKDSYCHKMDIYMDSGYAMLEYSKGCGEWLKVKLFKFILKVLGDFFIILGILFFSVIIHEIIHIIQYGGRVAELCFTNNRGDGIVAYVSTYVEDKGNYLFGLELDAYIIQFIIIIIFICVFYVRLRINKDSMSP